MSASGKSGTGPGKIIVEFDDGTRCEIKRVRLDPLTEVELWEAIQKYFPPELRAAAANRLLAMNKAMKPIAQKRKRGNPSKGIGAEVDALIHGPFRAAQDTTRQLVAARLLQKKKKWKVLVQPSPTKIITEDAAADAAFKEVYDKVAVLHRQYLQRKRKPKPKPKPNLKARA